MKRKSFLYKAFYVSYLFFAAPILILSSFVSYVLIKFLNDSSGFENSFQNINLFILFTLPYASLIFISIFFILKFDKLKLKADSVFLKANNKNCFSNFIYIPLTLLILPVIFYILMFASYMSSIIFQIDISKINVFFSTDLAPLLLFFVTFIFFITTILSMILIFALKSFRVFNIFLTKSSFYPS